MRALAAATLLVLALIPACSRKPADPVAALLAELEAAAEKRDAERFGARLSSEFRSGDGLGRPEAIALLRRWFAAYESVGIEVYGVETEREGASAHVRCVVCSERAREAVIVEGVAEEVTHAALVKRLAGPYHRKYKPWTLDPSPLRW